MKKILFLLLVTISSYAQTYQNPTFGTVKSMTAPTVSTTPTLGTIEANGTISKIVPNNVPITYTPINYAPSSTSIADQLAGIDTRLGQIGNVTAGVTTRVHLTGDNITVTAGTFFASNTTGKGATAAGTPQQTLSNNDDQKQYFTKDVMSVAVPALTTAPPGVYSGQLTVTSDPTPGTSKQRFTIEIYKCNNGGTPIASGITGAPVGNLGVTVVAILDSGLINVVASALTNIGLQGNLASTLTLNTGERLRYHVSAEKVGTDGGAVTMNVYYGTNYNSYYDIPVTFRASTVLNDSGVSGQTVANALDNLNAAIPVNYSNVVYVNNNNPNSATIFDLNNPPVTNDNLLKSDVNNLYIGLDASTWVYNSTSLTYVTKTVTSATSNFYLAGTTTDAGNSKTAAISRTGTFSGLLELTTNPLGSTLNRIGQTMTNTDNWRIYGDAASSDLGIMVFEVGDNSVPGINSQRFEFRYKSPTGVGDITPFTINYDAITSTLPLTATSFIKTGGLATESLLANGGVLSNPVSGTGTTNYISKWSSTSAQANSRIFDNATNFVGLNSTAPYIASMGQTLNINATGTDQLGTLEIVGNTSVNGNTLGRIIFANNNGALPSAYISATRENGNSTFGDLHFDVRGSSGYISNAFRIASTGALSMSVTPTTAAGSYDFLVRNSSTGVFEKVLSSTIALDANVLHTTGNESFTGIKSSTVTAGNFPAFALTSAVPAGNLITGAISGTSDGIVITGSGRIAYSVTGTHTTGFNASLTSGTTFSSTASVTANGGNFGSSGSGYALRASSNSSGDCFLVNPLNGVRGIYVNTTDSNASLGVLVNSNGTGNSYTAQASGVTNYYVSSTGAVNGVKTYNALITQSSTGAPTVTVLGFNTIGSIVWTRTTTGSYVGTLTGAFTASKTMCFINNTVVGSNTFQQATANTVTLTTADSTGTLLDGRLTANSIRIEVYP